MPLWPRRSTPSGAGFRGRDGRQRLAIWAIRLVAQGQASLRGSAPRNWGKNVTLLASITRRCVGPCLAVDGSTTREVFEACLEAVLPPTLKVGQVVVMDNLSAHKGGRVREIVEGAGCELIYLPPYSSDYNPIEQAFSKVKGLLRKAEARTRESLIEAMGRALSALRALEARGFFEHCGYREVVQPL